MMHDTASLASLMLCLVAGHAGDRTARGGLGAAEAQLGAQRQPAVRRQPRGHGLQLRREGSEFLCAPVSLLLLGQGTFLGSGNLVMAARSRVRPGARRHCATAAARLQRLPSVLLAGPARCWVSVVPIHQSWHFPMVHMMIHVSVMRSDEQR